MQDSCRTFRPPRATPTRLRAALGLAFAAALPPAALAQEGITVLDGLDGAYTAASAVSADGMVVVGQAYTAAGNPHAVRWTSAGITDLGTLGGGAHSSAWATSADGAVVVGGAETAASQIHAFRWASGLMTDLGTLGGTSSAAYGVSADGAVVVGEADTAGGRRMRSAGPAASWPIWVP